MYGVSEKKDLSALLPNFNYGDILGCVGAISFSFSRYFLIKKMDIGYQGTDAYSMYFSPGIDADAYPGLGVFCFESC